MAKKITESPKTTDEILFELTTTSFLDVVSDPYRVDRVVIYYLVREFNSTKSQEMTTEVSEDLLLTSYFSRAQVIKVFGNDDFPAWLSTDDTEALIEKVGIGEFTLNWTPEFAREGDYIVCWTWTPIIAGEKRSSFDHFYLAGDTQTTTSIPTHYTDPDKYTTLLEKYLPEYLKLRLGDEDLTPDTLTKLNSGIADGFILLENLANQIVDLHDANSIHEQLILYLSNMFNLILRSNDVTLWRRQIKNAVPLFKKKGTLNGLKEALSQAGIKFNSLTQLWQVSSPWTWQESFTVSEGQAEFELTNTVHDTDNFELFIRLEGENDYTELTASDYAEISYDSDDAVYILTWIGDEADSPIELSKNDIIRVIYKTSAIGDSNIEDYIMSLPLADTRDEAEVTYPLKNWNVRLIEETDVMFDTICPTRNPFKEPLIYGKVRTIFPYSENAYNMEEYNGSLRDSINPCDLSKDFLDSCSCCLSSNFNIDVEIEDLSTNRIDEAREIIREFVPFHSTIYRMNFQGGINEIIPPPQEDLEIIARVHINETIVNSNDKFTRVIEDGLLDSHSIKRNALGDASVVASGTGSGSNQAIVLYSPGVRFDVNILGLDSTNNLLEILSGSDTGRYKVTNPSKLSVDIVQGDPDTINFPLDASSFPFRLSNELFSGSVVSITQQDLFTFTDNNTNFRFSNVEPGWQIEVTSPVGVAGTYTISQSFPNDSITLSTWADVVDRSNITYQLKTDLGVNVGDSSSTGKIEVTRRAVVDGDTDFKIKYGVTEGDYLDVSETQYKIISFEDDDSFVIDGWTGGSVGITSANVYRRLLDQAIGYLDVRGLVLDTSPTNHESGLSISNGSNELGPLLENNQFKENFLLLINGKYYEMAGIDAEAIVIHGPKLEWGLSGTSVDYDIIKVEKQSSTIQGHSFSFIDRRNGDIVDIDSEFQSSMSMMSMLLNNKNSSGALEIQKQSENVTVEINWKE